MVNVDKMNEKKTEIMNNLANSIRDNDAEAMQKAMQEWSDFVSNAIIAEANGIISNADCNILATRGVRQLTNAETKFYNSMIENMQNGLKTITAPDETLPDTVFESVFEDIKTSHPLLALIDFKNTSFITKIIYNKMGEQRAVWGQIGSEINKELSGEIGLIETTLCKLTAFMYVSKDMLKLGPAWIDRYVRETLAEACAVSLEVGIVDGTGNDMPIGMTRSVADKVTVTGGVYPRKESVSVTSFDKITYGTILAILAKTPNGKTRTVNNVVMVCNPADYFSKIMPATTLLLPDGTYRNNILPFPTSIIQSVGVPQGTAIVGLPKRYFAGLGSNKNGTIEYDDSFKFLDDWRTYTIKLFGTGKPLDDNSFVVLDISNLEDTFPIIATKNYNETRLHSLSFGSLTLSPKFDKNTLYYTTETTSSTNTITAVAKDIDANVSIKNGTADVTSGSAATWKDGINNVEIAVSNGGDTRIYTVTVVKS